MVILGTSTSIVPRGVRKLDNESPDSGGVLIPEVCGRERPGVVGAWEYIGSCRSIGEESEGCSGWRRIHCDVSSPRPRNCRAIVEIIINTSVVVVFLDALEGHGEEKHNFLEEYYYSLN